MGESQPGDKIAARVDQKRTDDPVDLVARTVSFQVRGDLLYSLATDFEVHEPGEQLQPATADPEEIFVEFDAEVSKDFAIEALESIVHKIKLDGLPEVRIKRERRQLAS
jgi:hypothetical protein